MTKSKPTPEKHAVGDVVEVPEGATVVRPDGTENTVTGGSDVIDEPGDYMVDGSPVTAK